MGLFIILLFLIPAVLIVLGLRFMKKYEKLSSEDTYTKAAQQKADELKYKDPVIACDFCGNTFDTGLYKRCPNCGGEYSHDKEWLERHAVDMDPFRKAAELNSSDKIKKYEKASHGLLVMYKVLLIIGGVLLAGFILLLIVFLIDTAHPDYAASENVNRYGYDSYTAVSEYGISGTGDFLNYNGVFARVSDIYRDDSGMFKIELTVGNPTETDYEIIFDVMAVNDTVDVLRQTYKYLWVKPGTEIKVYLETEKNLFAGIKNVTFSGMEVRTEEHTEFEDDSLHVIETTYTGDVLKKMDEEVLYEDDCLKIARYTDNSGKDTDTVSLIFNKCDSEISVDSESARISGVTKISEDRYRKRQIPAHGALFVKYFFSYLPYDDYKSNDYELSFSVQNLDNPQKSYTTEYVRIE